MPQSRLLAQAFALSGVGCGFALVVLALSSTSPLSHMAAHILLMSALAPLLAVQISGGCLRNINILSSGLALAAATAAQIMLLYAWHAPRVAAALATSQATQALMALALFVVALLFWLAILAQDSRWRSVAALAITGKIYCLLGVLLLFAPRVLGGAHHLSDASLVDQRAAGLLMLAVCPLSYVATGIAIAAHEALQPPR